MPGVLALSTQTLMTCTRKFNVLCIFGLINTPLTQNEAIYDAHSAPEDLPHSRTAQLLRHFYPHFATGSTKILTPQSFARHTLRDITSHLQIVMLNWEIVLKRKLMSGRLRLPRVVNGVDQSGIIVVPTCHVSF